MSDFFKSFSQARTSPSALVHIADDDNDITPANRKEFTPP
jgi:hypothetical protein